MWSKLNFVRIFIFISVQHHKIWGQTFKASFKNPDRSSEVKKKKWHCLQYTLICTFFFSVIIFETLLIEWSAYIENAHNNIYSNSVYFQMYIIWWPLRLNLVTSWPQTSWPTDWKPLIRATATTPSHYLQLPLKRSEIV